MDRTRAFAFAAGTFLFLALLSGASSISLFNKLSTAQRKIDDIAATADRAASLAATDINSIAARLVAAERERDSITTAVRTRPVAQRIAEAAADSAVREAPDTCQPAIAALQVHLADAAKDAITNFNAWQDEAASHDRTKQTLIRAQIALVEARRSFEVISVKAREIELPRPSLLSRILPQSSVGCTAGLSPITARPGVVCGASLGWKVSL